MNSSAGACCVETLETAAVWDRLEEVYGRTKTALEEALDQGDVRGLVMTHLSHAYPHGANLYFTFITPQIFGDEEGQWRRAKEAAVEAILGAGGALSHHHGVGRDHKPWLSSYWGEDLLQAFRAAKTRLDPLGLLNPGIVIDPETVDPGPPEAHQPFSEATRRDNLRRLGREVLDVLIVGGGIVGAGAAWDASLRGLTVGLVEKEDFASGTSGKSSRMIHGGLRYLKQLDVKLVRESLHERHRLLRLAPHLVRVVPHLAPVYKGDSDSRTIMHLGLWGYDTLAGKKGLPQHKSLTAEEALEMEPALKAEGLEGGLVYYDALTDDARLTLEVVKAAARFGAAPANHVEALAMNIGPSEAEIELLDRLTGRRITARARVVLNAAGVWSDRIRATADPQAETGLRPAKGIHLCFPRELRPIDQVIILKGADGRPLFAVPSGDMVYVGTTDVDYEGDLDQVHADADEADYLLEAVNRLLPGPPIGRDLASASWAGIRPLVGGGLSNATKDISREHEIKLEHERLLTIRGGKLTTFRLMAAQVVDRVMDILERPDQEPAPTDRVPLCGSDRAADETNLAPTVVRRLKNKYGPWAAAIMDMARARGLEQILDEELGLTAAEVYWAVRGEMALTLTDALVRRLGLTYTTPDSGLAAAGRVAEIMANILGWDRARIEREMATYLEYVQRERDFRNPS